MGELINEQEEVILCLYDAIFVAKEEVMTSRYRIDISWPHSYHSV